MLVILSLSINESNITFHLCKFSWLFFDPMIYFLHKLTHFIVTILCALVCIALTNTMLFCYLFSLPPTTAEDLGFTGIPLSREP